VAAFNPQLAAWSHSPFSAEIEQLLVHAFGNRLGYEPSRIDGTFASGGAEANHTAILTALVKAFPQFAVSGLRGLDCQPVFYVSNQSHHSFIKAARFCGLGTDAVREIPVDEYFQMDVGLLTFQIMKDRSENFFPFMVVAMAGTTSGGIIDPIASIAKVATAEGLWSHVDAALGGAALLVPELRRLFKGIERADSITFDAHKWLSVPMAAGLYLTRHIDILSRTCCFTANYMPRDAIGLDVVDPYTHSMQWSRRFIGLKVFLSLAIAGWDAYETTIRHQVEMGQLLRRGLRESKWKVVNKTDLPVVCFVDQVTSEGQSFTYLEGIAREVVSSGKAWISITRLDENTPVLRACITNYRTESEDVIALMRALNEARKSMAISP
jgi:glutamate/tyrosine decarboxylase-like PLP-dependent enzyme